MRFFNFLRLLLYSFPGSDIVTPYETVGELRTCFLSTEKPLSFAKMKSTKINHGRRKMNSLKKMLAVLAVFALAVNSNGQLLSEDFESGTFPPTGWSNPGGWGSIVWSNYYGVSGFGNGDYSAFYDGYFWDSDADSMITDVFSPTSGESLIFDHAYAPYDNTLRLKGASAGPYIYSDLYIYYRLDGDSEWFYL